MTDRLAELGALQWAVENLATAGTNPNRLGLAGYIHAAYTDYQTWAAANPGVNPNRLSARGRLYGYFYDNGDTDAVIKALFASGEQGAWYDPSDLSTMFQDSAGTTPVTEDGQPVGKILDKSGRNNHASQATAAARPLYKTSGGLHWLQFDGVDDGLVTAAIDFTATDKMSTWSGTYTTRLLTGFYDSVYGTGDSTGVPGVFGLNMPSSANLARYDMSGATTAIHRSFSITDKRLLISASLSTTGTSQMKVRMDGVLVTDSGATDSGGGAFGNRPFTIGSVTATGGANPYTGNIYSLIIRGELSTTQEITDTETWVAGKTGISL